MQDIDTHLDLEEHPEPAGIKFDIQFWPTPEDTRAFHELLQALFADRYDQREAERLLDLAGKRFEDADAYYEWSDLDLWTLLNAAEARIDWLLQLFGGATPEDWPLPKNAVEKGHIADPVRRRVFCLDKDGHAPSRHNPRLRALLARAAGAVGRESKDDAGRDLSRALSVLEGLRAAVSLAAETIEPPRGAPNRKRIKQLRNSLLDGGVKATDISHVQLTWLSMPIRQGRRPVPPALVDLVAEMARAWAKALGQPPSKIRAPSTSAAHRQFLLLLRALEKAHRRRPGELGKAVIDKALTASRKSAPEKTAAEAALKT